MSMFECDYCNADTRPYLTRRVSNSLGNSNWVCPVCYRCAMATEPGSDLEVTPAIPRCLTCKCELSETMDAYHGRDPVEANQCIKCRGKTRVTDYSIPF